MRVSVNRQAAQDDARLVVFELGNFFLGQHRVLAEALGLKPVPALIVLTVAISTVQKYMRQSAPDPAFRSAVPLPDALSGGISRRAIARATGLPTETVRRCVEELVGLRRLEILSAQMVRTPPGSISMISQAQIEAMLTGLARQTETLVRAGVLELSATRRPASERAPAVADRRSSGS